MRGKIVKGIAGFYYVHDGRNTVYECKARGVFRKEKLKPLVGDDVEISVLSTEPPEGSIEQILPRRSSLIRPAVANIDQALILFAAAEPEPDRNLLDRLLVRMARLGIPATVAFNKSELAAEEKKTALKKAYEAAGYEVRFLSAREGSGIEELRGFLRGKTTALAGPSGVGKSTLTNQFFCDMVMETGTINTTRHSELFYLETGTYLMDTPGFSSILPEDCPPEELKDYFPEFAPFEAGCRFLGCVHVGERDCGVKDAVAEGAIDPLRYENYRLFYDEIKNRKRY